jgi:hypothetical protein
VRGVATRARPAALGAAVLLLAGCTALVATEESPDAAGATASPPTSSADPLELVPDRPVPDEAGLQGALDALAAAVRAGDPAFLDGWLLDPDGPVAARWRARVEAAAGVPFAAYDLRLEPGLPTLTTEGVRGRWGDDAELVLVVEEHRLEGHDEDGPRRDQQALTFVPDGDRWLLADDRGGAGLGLVRTTQLWDLGPVAATARDGLLALHRPEAGGVDRLLDEAERALGLARERWPLPWAEAVPLLVPADTDELGELLNVTFDLDEFVAFATSTPSIRPDEHRLTGSRVVLNPGRFDGRDPATRELVLVHELLHVASRPYSTASTPLWLEEGVAQVLGEQRSSTGTRLLAAAGRDGRRLPADAEFTTGGTDQIHLAYQRAWSFADHLVRRFGDEAFARFYAEVGVGSAKGPGTVAYRVDRASREVFGVPLATLLADWRDEA